MKPLLQRTISPVDGSVYVEREFASDQAIEATLAKAVSAQPAWKQVPVAERAASCRRMADWCVANADQLGEERTWQIGRPIAQSPGEIRGGLHGRVKYMSGIDEETLADLAVEKKAGFQRFIRREPLGVVLVLAPWNYPWLTSVNAVVAALLAGNTIVLKMAQQTPLVAERYRQAFAAAGLPDGVFHFLHIDHESAERVIADPRIGFIAITGSVGGVHAVQRAAAGRFIATRLELGGTDPADVRADAPLRADGFDLDRRCASRDPDRRSRRNRHLVHESLRLPGSGACLDRSEGLRTRLHAVPAGTGELHPSQVLPFAIDPVVHIGLLECDHVAGRFPGIAGGYREMFAALLGPHAPGLRFTYYDA